MPEIPALPMRVCNSCGAVYMEDDRMYVDTDRCPECGKYLSPPDSEVETDHLPI